MKACMYVPGGEKRVDTYEHGLLSRMSLRPKPLTKG